MGIAENILYSPLPSFSFSKPWTMEPPYPQEADIPSQSLPNQLVAASSQKCVAPHRTLVKKSHCALQKAPSPQHCGREGVLTHRPKAFYLRTQRRHRGIRAKASGQQTSLGVLSESKPVFSDPSCLRLAISCLSGSDLSRQ